MSYTIAFCDIQVETSETEMLQGYCKKSIIIIITEASISHELNTH